MTSLELRRRTWAMVAAALARDTDGLSALIDDLDAMDARDALFGLAVLVADASDVYGDRDQVLALVRSHIAELAGWPG